MLIINRLPQKPTHSPSINLISIYLSFFMTRITILVHEGLSEREREREKEKERDKERERERERERDRERGREREREREGERA